jgi:hypothetical protein
MAVAMTLSTKRYDRVVTVPLMPNRLNICRNLLTLKKIVNIETHNEPYEITCGRMSCFLATVITATSRTPLIYIIGQ